MAQLRSAVKIRNFYPLNDVTFQGLCILRTILAIYAALQLQTKLSSFKIKRSLSPGTTFKTSDINKVILSALQPTESFDKTLDYTSLCMEEKTKLQFHSPLPPVLPKVPRYRYPPPFLPTEIYFSKTKRQQKDGRLTNDLLILRQELKFIRGKGECMVGMTENP